MPSTACERGKMTALFQLISDQFSTTNLTTVQRKYFNESKGLEYIKQLCVPEYNTVEMGISAKYYALSTAAALIKYVEFIQNIVYAPNSLKIVFKGSEQATLIDASVAKHLELIQNLRDPSSDHSLYGILNKTKTAGGVRLLRSNILQPPSDVATITTRLDCVSELTEKESLFYGLQSVISRFLDVEHLISMFIQIPKREDLRVAEMRITQLIYLKHTLELVQPLQQALADGENPLFQAYHKSLQDPRYSALLESIQTVIHDDTCYQKGSLNMRTQKVFAIKPCVNGLLDVARRTYTEIVDDILEMIKQLSTRFNLPLRPSYSTTRGFFIQLALGKEPVVVDTMPSCFIKVVKTRNIVSFTTEDLIKMNDRISESLSEIYLLSNVIISELLTAVRGSIGCFYKLAECVSMLDMLVAFAHLCTVSNYVRPEFTDTLAIKQGRHPILEKMGDQESIVANDVYASDVSNFIMITGPNMSGKSTYLKQIVLLQIMAQIGSFVPAAYASFRIATQIFARVGSDDDIESNSSTFMLEMREINYIIQNGQDNSLIIIDELGRGTSTEEGIGIAHSICEHLLKLKAFTFFATHFLDLCNLDALYPNVENYHLEVQNNTANEHGMSTMLFTHVLTKGRAKEENYGLRLAEMSALPISVTANARKLATSMAKEREVFQLVSPECRRQKANYQLATRLIQAAKYSTLDEDALRGYMKNIKQKYELDLEPNEE